MLVTHANMKEFGLTPLFGDRCGYMPPQLKTKQVKVDIQIECKERSVSRKEHTRKK